MNYKHINHDSIPPFYDTNSKILILGSFPSVGSRKSWFYYGHKTNSFLKILSLLFCKKEPITIIDGKLFLKRHNIALFDVIKECNIKGSSDSSIKNVIVNNFSNIFKESKIKKDIY